LWFLFKVPEIKTKLLIFFLVAPFTLFSICSAAQDQDQQISVVTIIIQPTSNLGIVDANVSETLIQNETAEDRFDKGGVELAANKPTLIIDSNQKWKLTARTSGFSGPYLKDTKDIMLKDSSETHVENGFNDFKSLSDKDQEIAAYSAGVKNENHPYQYKILLDYSKDVPGTYTATVIFTLSTQGA